MPVGAELVERGAHARGLVLARGDDHLGAGGLERVGGEARGGARDDDDQRHLERAAHELGVQRQPRLGVEDDARAAGVKSPSMRAVSCGSSASAVPLQLQAYNLNNSGKSEEALPVAQKAVKLGCKGSAPVNPCGYALFELARAQRGSGDPESAIRTLEERKRRYPNDQKAAVDAELRRAQQDAGQ